MEEVGRGEGEVGTLGWATVGQGMHASYTCSLTHRLVANESANLQN